MNSKTTLSKDEATRLVLSELCDEHLEEIGNLATGRSGDYWYNLQSVLLRSEQWHPVMHEGQPFGLTGFIRHSLLDDKIWTWSLFTIGAKQNAIRSLKLGRKAIELFSSFGLPVSACGIEQKQRLRWHQALGFKVMETTEEQIYMEWHNGR